MTTPNQPAPDGAYVVDTGGGEANFGQNMTEAGAASLMTGGFTSINLGNPLEAVGSVVSLFERTLSSIPLEVLQLFEGLIPDALEGAFGTVAGAIGAIVNHIQSLGPLLASAFKGFLEVSYNVLQSAFGQIMDIVQGLLVTPINGAVAGFKDWFTGLMGGTIPDLGAAVNGAVDDLADLVHDLLTTPATVLGSIPQTLVSGLTGALADVDDFIRGVIDAIVRGIRGIPFVGGTIANAIDALTGAVSDQQVNQQNATITVAATMAGNPGWIARYPLADVSYIEALNTGYDVYGTTGAPSTGTAHTHVINATANAQTGAPVIGQNTARFAIITIANPAAHDTVAVMLQKAAGTSPNNITVELYRLNAAGDTSGLLFTSSDISSLFTTNTTYVELPLPAASSFQTGEQYMVKVRNASTNTTAIGWSGLLRDTASANVGGYLTGADVSQTSYTAAELAAGSAANSRLCWAMLATKNPARSPKSYSDDFNNRRVLGPLWLPTSNTGANQIGITNSQLAFKSTTNGDQVALYRDPTDDDEMLVEANLYNRVTTPRLGVMSCCNRDLTQVVYLGVNASTANLYVGAWNSLGTAKKSVSVTSGDAKWGVYNDPGTSTFYIMRDGTDIDSWVDTGGAVQLGYDYRWGGAFISRASGVNAGTLDNFLLCDFAR